MPCNEQSIVSDQDNALVLGDDFDSARHDAYFLELARRVSDGLAACGYTYCKGDVMATNPRWRQPLSVWRQYFSDWIDHPTPERLLHSNIFFDLDSVYGENPFVESLQDLVAERAKDSELFLAAMARNALNRTPPLGFFRDFVMEKDGKHNNSINVKRRGTAPLVDLIRVHALACGSRAQNSFERLDDIGRIQLLQHGWAIGCARRWSSSASRGSVIRSVRIWRRREPETISNRRTFRPRERRDLKEAFQALSNAQKFLKFRYPMPAGR
ncbi:MAG: putative nucleotidyltransferase substrate binding domain-containing protein [Arhodomonas sp.]|nr:putative nucleotidyltransferase substrate binding domain-containing protein [Arhodomonas sp.]